MLGFKVTVNESNYSSVQIVELMAGMVLNCSTAHKVIINESNNLQSLFDEGYTQVGSALK